MSQMLQAGSGPGRAGQIHWREWGPEAFAAAAAADAPVLLNLTASWCHWCGVMDETTWSHPDVISRVTEQLVAIRVDADRYPHVQDRYIAGGWPTIAFLTPTGEVLWAGTYTEADQLLGVAASVLDAWQQRRDELQHEIARRRSALESARGRLPDRGLVRREAADDVLAATLDLFDARNGGFGDAPKFPPGDAIQLLYSHAADDAAAADMADRTLDGMLAGELWDVAAGGFFRYATAADWTAPRREKLLESNAGLLEAYARGAWLRGRDDWRRTAAQTVRWVDETLALEDGLWAGSQNADDDWASAPAPRRAALPAPPVDATVHTSWNARWITALAVAGARLDQPDWVQRAATSLRTLLDGMATPAGGLYHFRPAGGEPAIDFLLADTLHAARAAIEVGQATGDEEWLATARRLLRHLEHAFWSDDGGFYDRRASSHDIGALHYRDRPFEENALAARLLLDIAHITGERGCRALAERTLARIGAVAGRHGPDGAIFALATAEYFDAPPTVVIALPDGATADDAAEFRRAAWALRAPGLRVWTVRSGHRAGPHVFAAASRPALYLWTRRGCTGPLDSAEALAQAAVSRHA
jgi:uncharacterized protein